MNITQCPTNVTEKTATISGDLRDSNYSVSLTINGKSIPVYSYGWSTTVNLVEGDNTFTFVASSSAGKTVTETRTIILSVGSPTIRFINCPEQPLSQNITMEGYIEGETSGIRLYINDQHNNVDYGGSFKKNITLNEGINAFTFRAVNSFGKETIVNKTISYIPLKPEAVLKQDAEPEQE